MKKSFVFFCALVIGALSFSSCNKSLKDDIKELRNQLGFDEPIVATSTYVQDGVTKTITGTYKFKDGASYSNGLVKNSDGTYDIVISRFDAIHGEEGVYLYFNYNPTTKEFGYREANHYWKAFSQGEYGHTYVDTDEEREGLEFDINIKTLDLESGLISVEVKVVATDDYVDYYGGGPLNYTGFTTTFSFSGKLKKFENVSELPR